MTKYICEIGASSWFYYKEIFCRLSNIYSDICFYVSEIAEEVLVLCWTVLIQNN